MTTSPAFPAALTEALAAKAQGFSRIDGSERAAAISQTYRSGGNSIAIRSEADALAYALARMPATYAAVVACLNAVMHVVPDFAPTSLLDCGAGPGTATFAATQVFTFDAITLLDANPALRAIALDLAGAMAFDPFYDLGDLFATLAKADAADLVVASYVVNELPDAKHAALADALWAKTRDMLLVVEPGTPNGHARILALRSRLIGQGAHVIAPCPHDEACPLQPPDWCHFVQRLPRSRAHMALKAAEVPFEDEKFCYVALSRTPVAQRLSRVLAQPEVTKIAATVRLCTPGGLDVAVAPKRDKAAYRRFKKLDWGDTIETRSGASHSD